jgi:hypothetical protein
MPDEWVPCANHCGQDATDRYDDPDAMHGVVWLCDLCAAAREMDCG